MAATRWDRPESTRNGTIWYPTVPDVRIVSISAEIMNQKADVARASPAVQSRSSAADARAGCAPPSSGRVATGLRRSSPSGTSPMSSGRRRMIRNRGTANNNEKMPSMR